MAKGEDWKDVSRTTRDAVTAKQRVESSGGAGGLTWIGGAKRGGRNQAAIEVIRDVMQAGYNVTMNRPPAASATTVFPPTTKLAEAFASPSVAADWAVSVIGDKQISLCDEVGCQAKASTPGGGLLPKYETERSSCPDAAADRRRRRGAGVCGPGARIGARVWRSRVNWSTRCARSGRRSASSR